MRTIIYNGSVITRTGLIEHGGLIIDSGKIAEIIASEPAVRPGDELVDAGGLYISPGFVDSHIHGGGGADVMDGTAEAVLHIAKTHIKYGLTSFLPTTLTADPEKINAACSAVRAAMAAQAASPRGGAKILGIHLEGPFISLKFKGAQNPLHIQAPSIEAFIKVTGGGDSVLRVSMAPEIPGAFELARYLADRGVLVSVAHSDAGYDVMHAAAEHGFSHITHMFNGMSGIKSPDYYASAGVIESALELDAYSAEIICDGRHMPPELIRLLAKCKPGEQMMLTSDATRPTDMPEGPYELGGLPVILTDGVAMLADRSAFAGSVATSDRLVRNAVKYAGFDIVSAVNMLSYNVAKSIGVSDCAGSLEPGKAADVLLFDGDINIKQVFCEGLRI